MKIAVIDLGSNSLRMGIYERINSQINLIEQFRFPTRLSEGLQQNNHLLPAPMKRTEEAFLQLKSILNSRGISKHRAVATESLRRAKNKDEFIARISKTCGINLEIISGENEARYGAYAASLVAGTEDFYMIDNGGGSCEIVLVKNNKPVNFVSLPLGSVVLTEEYKPDANGTSSIFNILSENLSSIPWLTEKELPIVALGGSNKQLGIIHFKNPKHSLDGVFATVDELKSTFNSILITPQEERIDIEGMEPSRTDTIVAGLCPIFALADKTSCKKIIFCDKSLREGIAAELFDAYVK